MPNSKKYCFLIPQETVLKIRREHFIESGGEKRTILFPLALREDLAQSMPIFFWLHCFTGNNSCSLVLEKADFRHEKNLIC